MISQRAMVAASLASTHHPDVYSRHTPDGSMISAARGIENDREPTRPATRARSASTTRAATPCPKCDKGMRTDLNGARWKCSYCGGRGVAPLTPPRAIPGSRRLA